MNTILEQFARKTIKEGLALCTDGERLTFNKMYSHKELDKDVDAVVDDMSMDKLDWAMQQVKRSVDKHLEEESA